jgi:CTP synthase
VIDLLPEQKEVADLGGTMRLGADPIKLHAGHRARELYGEASSTSATATATRSTTSCASARGRRPVVSGTSPDERLVEIIELGDHPF